MSRDESTIPNHSSLQTLNSTTEHFLGTVRRDWMNKGDAVDATRRTINPQFAPRPIHKEPIQTRELSNPEDVSVQARPFLEALQSEQPAVPPQALPAPSHDLRGSRANPDYIGNTSNVFAHTANSLANATTTMQIPTVTGFNGPSTSLGSIASNLNEQGQDSTPATTSPSLGEADLPAHGSTGVEHSHPYGRAYPQLPAAPLALRADTSEAAALSSTGTTLPPTSNSGQRIDTAARPIVAGLPEKSPRDRPLRVPRVLLAKQPPNGSGAAPLLPERTAANSRTTYLTNCNSRPSNYLQLLEDRINAIRAISDLNHYDNIRISWLRGACQCEDHFFLFIHQLLSIQTVMPQYLSTKYRFSPRLLQAFGLLNYVLMDSNEVSSLAMNLFVNFTVDFHIFHLNRNVTVMLPRALDFLNSLIDKWEALRLKVLARGSPPCARELARELSCDGQVISQAFFNNFFCQLFPFANSSFTETEFHLFKLSQQTFYQRRQAGILDTSLDTLTYYQEVRVFDIYFSERARNFLPTPRGIGSSSNLGTANGPMLHATTGAPQPSSSPLSEAIPALHSGQYPTPQTNPAHTVENQHNTPGQPFPTAPKPAPPIVSDFNNFQLLVPPLGQFLPVTRDPDPNRIALHQTNLAGPTLVQLNEDDNSKGTMRLYAFLDCSIGSQKLIDKDTVFETWSADIPDKLWASRAEDSPMGKEIWSRKPTRSILNDSIIFQLRCVRATDAKQVDHAADYSALNTSWPEHIFISVNDTHLDFRRKSHHGKDLPVDIHNLLHLGSNELKLAYYANNAELNKIHAIILEAVKILDHEEVLKLPGFISAHNSLKSITSAFQNRYDDDDLVMADSFVSIDLIDPFMARIFDQPVRGRSCRHRECFDLEAFLRSRDCRNKDGFVHSDEWKCPLCGEDARPSSLVVDEFLLHVKQKLIDDGQQHAKVILVKEDGTWQAKVESTAAAITTSPKNDENRSESTERRLAGPVPVGFDGKVADTPQTRSQLTPVSSAPVVISLSDEDD